MELNPYLLVLSFAIILGLSLYFLRMKKGPKKMQCQLVEKKKLTHDTIIFTFTIPN